MAIPWKIPPMFKGKTVAVLASGESLSREVVDAVKAAEIPALVTNNTFELAPWADILVANDAAWWSARAQDALKFAGIKFCAQTGMCPFPQVVDLKMTGARIENCGFDPDPENIRTGGNSGYTAVHIAMQAGAKRILLCGMNMGGDNWHGTHSFPLRTTHQSTYSIWAKRFETLVEPAKMIGCEIINCTSGSGINCFPFANLEDELEKSLQPNPL